MPGSPYAGIVTRLAALAVDAVLLTLAIPFVANGAPSLWSALHGKAPGWLVLGSQLAAALLPFAYFSLCWWGGGRTVGGLLFGTVVRRRGGAPLGPGRATARAVIGLALPLVWLVGLITIMWDDRRRALHDRLFGTVVLRAVRQPGTGHQVPVAGGRVDIPA
jgi:uncharacterized RDD family membrane protein YckC